MKTILSFLLCIYSFSIFGQNANASSKDSVEQIELYLKYKKDLERYEQKRGKYIQTRNVLMHYLTWGKTTGVPLVWVHGTYSNAYELLEIVDSLSKFGFYVLAIDYYGHGFTPIPNIEVSIYHVADDIKFLLDKLKIQKAVIGGWSRGGSIATAFYDAYPSSVLGLILEDGGSVACDVNNHKESIDSLTNETKAYYANKKNFTFATETNAYWWLYKNWGLEGKTGLKLKKEIFTSIARIKADSFNRWAINPGAEKLTGENNAEQDLANINQPFAARSLFGASTHLLYPKVIYRNLDVPMIIFDPLSKDDWYDFLEENTKLKLAHTNLITHKIYYQCWHGVKDEKPEEFLKDVKDFLKTVKDFNKIIE